MKRWKALAGATVVAALVLAPMASMGAYATEEIPDTSLTTAGVVGGEEPVADKVFICKYTGKPGVDEVLQGGGNPVNSSINSIKGNFPEGHVIQVGDTFGDDHSRSVIIAFDTGQDPEPTIDDCAPADGPDEVTPIPPDWDDACGPGNAFWDHPALTVGYHYNHTTDDEGNINVEIIAEEGYVFPEGTQTLYTDRDSNEPCITEYPVPTAFNADPEPATCAAAGSFSTAFLGDREPIDGGEGWATYEYENVYIEVDRTVDGEVTLFIWPKEGYVITNTEGWTQSEDEGGVYYYRTILIPEQLSGPELCPLAELPAPAAPTFTDECGVDNDLANVPADTEDYYYVATDDGDTVFVEVFLQNDEDTFPDGTVTEWVFTFTDVPCATPTPTPPAPAALPATGGSDMMPWGVGGAALLLAGAALLATRRLARR